MQTTRFTNSSFTLVRQQTLRLSFEFGGDFFLDRFSTSGLAGYVGGSASGSINYRLSKKTTINGLYSFSDFSYSGLYGNSQTHGFSIGAARQFNPQWQASINVGVNRTSTSGEVQIPIDSILASLLGTPYLTGRYDTTTYYPSYQLSIARVTPRWQARIAGGQSVSPAMVSTSRPGDNRWAVIFPTGSAEI